MEETARLQVHIRDIVVTVILNYAGVQRRIEVKCLNIQKEIVSTTNRAIGLAEIDIDAP